MMKGYDHTALELRALADELWERGFKEVSSFVHNLAALREWDDEIASRIEARKQKANDRG